MKAKTIELIKVIANLITWVFTGVNYRRRAKRCAAYKRGWCSGQYCGTCESLTDEFANVMQEQLNQKRNKEEEK